MKRTRDNYTRKAKQSGYPARSVFKLEEIHRRVRIFKPGYRVLDLGASPGSWSLFAAQQIGKSGEVIAVDIKELSSQAMPGNLVSYVQDVFELDMEKLGTGSFDVVMSDMAPSTTGHRGTDQARSFQLFSRALEIATTGLRPGGFFVGKIFQGPDFEEARSNMRQHFGKVRIIQPFATRKESIEVFLVGVGRK